MPLSSSLWKLKQNTPAYTRKRTKRETVGVEFSLRFSVLVRKFSENEMSFEYFCHSLSLKFILLFHSFSHSGPFSELEVLCGLLVHLYSGLLMATCWTTTKKFHIQTDSTYARIGCHVKMCFFVKKFIADKELKLKFF